MNSTATTGCSTICGEVRGRGGCCWRKPRKCCGSTRGKYADFNVRYLHEKLREEHGTSLSNMLVFPHLRAGVGLATPPQQDIAPIARPSVCGGGAKHRGSGPEPTRPNPVVRGRKDPCPSLYRTHPLLPMWPGQIKRRTHDDELHPFAVCLPGDGQRQGQWRVSSAPRAREFRCLWDMVEATTPVERDVHLILGN